jgi:hypothetical protein
VIDQGQNDPLPFDLTGWTAAAKAIAEHIKQSHGRDSITEIPIMT